MESIKVRPAAQKDVPDVVALYNLAKGIDAATFDVKTVSNIFERVRKHPNFHVFVAEMDSRVVGTFMLVVSEGTHSGERPEGIVENVVVHKMYQRRGIGKYMMDFAMKVCREAKCDKMRFSTNDRNAETSHLFETLGFERRGYGFVMDLDR